MPEPPEKAPERPAVVVTRPARSQVAADDHRVVTATGDASGRSVATRLTPPTDRRRTCVAEPEEVAGRGGEVAWSAEPLTVAVQRLGPHAYPDFIVACRRMYGGADVAATLKDLQTGLNTVAGWPMAGGVPTGSCP